VAQAQRAAALEIEIAGRRPGHASDRQYVDDVEDRPQPRGLTGGTGQQQARALAVVLVGHPHLTLSKRDERRAPHRSGRGRLEGLRHRPEQLVLPERLDEAIKTPSADEPLCRGEALCRCRRRWRGWRRLFQRRLRARRQRQERQETDQAMQARDTHRAVRPRFQNNGRTVVKNARLSV
jgi:hypothetical protein